MLMAILQFSLPGAPTIYNGDEVGLTGPAGWYNEKWEDDPYNRIPFPWADTPGHYTQRPDVLALYRRLGRIRAEHPALRTGSFDTLLTDDASAVYAFGRTLGITETAVVVVNRGTTAQTATVPLAGYVADDTLLTDHLNRAHYTVSSGEITLTLEPEWGAVLTTTPEKWIYLPLVMREG
jgi:glycosidase